MHLLIFTDFYQLIFTIIPRHLIPDFILQIKFAVVDTVTVHAAIARLIAHYKMKNLIYVFMPNNIAGFVVD